MPREALAHPEGIVVRRTAAALTCLSFALLSACSTPEPSPVPTPETSVGSTPDASGGTATTAPDDSVQTTSPRDAGADPGIPELPAEATEDTEAGAEAFVDYYFSLVNSLGKNPRPGVLERYGAPGCATCAALAKAIGDLHESGGRYEEDSFQILDLQSFTSESGFRVEATGFVPPNRVLDPSGDLVSTSPQVDESALVIELIFSGTAFTIESVKNIEG